MDAKLNHSDISTLLAEHCAIPTSKAEMFTRLFFELIIEGVEKDGSVKINGLGTFKMIDVANRSSVDVNTGEKIEIKGHRKLTFVPADSLKNKVNQPFAMFEPVEIDDEYVDEQPAESDLTYTPDTSDKSLSQLQTQQEAEVEFAPHEAPADKAVNTYIPHVEQESTSNKETEQGTVPEVSKESRQMLPEESCVKMEDKREDDKSESSKRYLIYLFSSATLLLLFAAGYWFFYDNKVEDIAAISVPVPRADVVETVDIAPIATEKEPQDTAFVIVEELQKISLAHITIKDTTLYVSIGNIAIHKVGLDETLTKISLKYYNDKKLWPYIVHYNNMADYNRLEIGMPLAIPRLVPRK